MKLAYIGLLALMCLDLGAMDLEWWQKSRHRDINPVQEEEEEKIKNEYFKIIQKFIWENPHKFQSYVDNTYGIQKDVKSADFSRGNNNWRIFLEYYPLDNTYQVRLQITMPDRSQKYYSFSEQQVKQLLDDLENAKQTFRVR